MFNIGSAQEVPFDILQYIYRILPVSSFIQWSVHLAVVHDGFIIHILHSGYCDCRDIFKQLMIRTILCNRINIQIFNGHNHVLQISWWFGCLYPQLSGLAVGICFIINKNWVKTTDNHTIKHSKSSICDNFIPRKMIYGACDAITFFWYSIQYDYSK